MNPSNDNRRNNIIEKSGNFFKNLLQVAASQAVEEVARIHVKDLIDSKITVEEFSTCIAGSLGLNLDRNVIDCLKFVLPLLRSAYLNRELIIDGVNPPTIGNELNTEPSTSSSASSASSSSSSSSST